MLSIPKPNNVSSVADWVEFYISYYNDELSKSALISFVQESSGEEPKATDIDDVWRELEFREPLYGDSPPYKVQGSIIEPTINWLDFPQYMTCLIFALCGNPVDSVASGTLFERITGEAAKNYVEGESIVVGFPNVMAITDIACAINEKYNCELPSYRKDRGVDVIAWKPFGDDRCSQMILLIQCAAGHNWSAKKAQVTLKAWNKYIHFACQPLAGLSIPVIISDSARLEDDSDDAGIIIDRSRIYKNTAYTALDQQLKGDLINWCNNRLPNVLDS